MTDWLGEMAIGIGSLVVDNPISVICWQVCLVVLLGFVFSRVLARQAGLQNAVWRTTIAALPLIALMHVFWGGWSFEVANDPTVLADSHLREVIRSGNTDTYVGDSAYPHAAVRMDQAGDFPDVIDKAGTTGREPAPAAISASTVIERQLEVVDSGSVDIVKPATNSRVSWRFALVAIYLGGLMVVLLRTLVGRWGLQSLVRRGDRPSESIASLAEQAASQLRLTSVPMVWSCPDLTMPLVHGFLVPTVLVPKEFSGWSETEQTAVLLHEFAHVARRDLQWAWLARLVEAIFWFHPASWLASRQLSRSCELATDQLVLQSGVEPSDYARELIDVIQRTLSVRQRWVSTGLPGLFGPPALEDRVQGILENVRSTVFQRRGTVIACVGLVLFAAVTTVRVKTVPAQTSSVTGSDKESKDELTDLSFEKSRSSSPTLFDSVTIDPSSLKSTASFIDALRSAPVVPNDPVSNHKRLKVSGHITLSNGEPAKYATVFLKRRLDSAIVNDEKVRALNRYEQNLIRNHDVFAKTTTNELGRYEFVDVVPNDAPSPGNRGWEWPILAISSEGDHFGWQSIFEEGGAIAQNDVDIQLEKTTSIRLRFVDTQAAPIPNAIVSLATLRFFGRKSRLFGDDFVDLHLLKSSASALAKSDPDGWIQVDGVPERHAATVAVFHPDRVARYSSIATSPEVKLGYVKRVSQQVIRTESDLVVSSPAVLIDDPGMEVRGKVVDENGIPVAGARISRSPTSSEAYSDAGGNFRTRLSTESIRQRDRMKESMAPSPGQGSSTSSSTSLPAYEIRYYIDGPQGTLYQREVVVLDEYARPTEIVAVLKKGVSVTGRVVSKTDGKAIEGVAIQMLNSPGAYLERVLTDKDGRFETALPRKMVELIPTPGSDLRNFLLPRNIGFPTKGERGLIDRLKISLDLSDGVARALDDIQIDELPKLKVQVVRANGEPAQNAEIVAYDPRYSRQDTASKAPRPPFNPAIPSEISFPVRTDADGRAELTLTQPASDESTVVVTFNEEGTSLNLRQPIPPVVKDVLRLKLGSQRKVSGRVLKNGMPVMGAEVVLQENQRHATSNGAPSNMFSSRAVKGVSPVTTDEEGRYSFSLESTGDYSVSLQKIPGVSSSSFDSFGRPSFSFFCSRSVPRDKQSDVDLNVFEGDKEISGTVVNSAGEPVQDIIVGIMSESSVSTQTWINHSTASQKTTDANGKFHLRKIPEGTYTLSAYKRPPPGQPTRSTRLPNITTGSQNVVIMIEDGSPPEAKRLEPKKVFDSKSKSSSNPK